MKKWFNGNNKRYYIAVIPFGPASRCDNSLRVVRFDSAGPTTIYDPIALPYEDINALAERGRNIAKADAESSEPVS